MGPLDLEYIVKEITRPENTRNRIYEMPVRNSPDECNSRFQPYQGQPPRSNQVEMSEHLRGLLHAISCIWRDQKMPRQLCVIEFCPKWRPVIHHMRTCSLGNQCEEPYCASSYRIINHWRHCTTASCETCDDVNQKMKHFTLIELLQSQDMVQEHVDSQENLEFKQAQDLFHQIIGMQTGLGFLKPKNWHQYLSPTMRCNIKRKFLQLILPHYSIPIDVGIIYTIRAECLVFQIANSKEQYFELLIDRIYKIQKFIVINWLLVCH